MQTCSRCQTQSGDSVITCPTCGADLKEFSAAAQALQRLLQNQRVLLVRLIVATDACPACQAVEGTYPKDKVPTLPVKGCSCPQGCTCFYEPLLNEIYP